MQIETIANDNNKCGEGPVWDHRQKRLIWNDLSSSLVYQFSPATGHRDVISRARQIATVTANRTMPPWLPGPGFGAFVNERRLKGEEVAAIQEWVKAGAPQGDPEDLPARPTCSG